MKRIISLLLLVFLSAQSLNQIKADVPAFAILPKKVVLIDAGHGGWERSAYS